MPCSKCGNQTDQAKKFCRKCGTDLEHASLASVDLLQRKSIEGLTKAGLKDPDELTGNGVASVFIGDGFFMVAVLLSATESSVSSLLWLLLLIPAFFFFGKGFADLFHARQIRRRMKQNELAAAPITAELVSRRASVIDVFKTHPSGDLIPAPSVTERTTRQLK